ncbi:MAG: transposase [Eubacteriales bacterium]|nr:transposase [Eubacteriales bacterium]
MNSEKRKKLIELMDEIDRLLGDDETLAEAVKEVKEEEAKESVRAATEVTEGQPTGPNHNTRVRYTMDFKKMIVGLHLEAGKTFTELTNQYGVSKATITKWCSNDRYIRNLNQNVAQVELEKMQKRCEELVKENDILKKTIQTLTTLGAAGGMA